MEYIFSICRKDNTMIKCKVVLEDKNGSECGKDICCGYCDKKDDCLNACAKACDNEHEGCEDAITTDEVQVFESKKGDVIKAFSELLIEQQKVNKMVDLKKEELVKAMEDFGVKKYSNDFFSATYKAPSTRKTVDSEKLKADGLYDKYTKVSNVKASVVIKVK